MAYKSFADFKWGAIQCEHSETHDRSSPCFLQLSGYLYLLRQLLYTRKRKVNRQLWHSLFSFRFIGYMFRKMCGKCSQCVRNRISVVLPLRIYFSSFTELQHTGKCSITLTFIQLFSSHLFSWQADIYKLTRVLSLNFLNHQKQLLKVFAITLTNTVL
jgi:hypothetical protein